MNNFNPYKPAIISFVINILIATILVAMFRSGYAQDSLAYDVFMFLLVVTGIQLAFGIKNILVSYIVTKLTGSDVVDLYYQNFIRFNFPKPNEIFHIDDPEVYLNDVMTDESLSADTRIYAGSLITEINLCRNQGKFYNLFIANSLLKKVIKKYAYYLSKI